MLLQLEFSSFDATFGWILLEFEFSSLRPGGPANKVLQEELVLNAHEGGAPSGGGGRSIDNLRTNLLRHYQYNRYHRAGTVPNIERKFNFRFEFPYRNVLHLDPN